jgi:hypothetical protein
MITVKDFMETVDYRITEGTDYLWNCFGPNAFRLDCWSGNTGKPNEYSISMVFDTLTQIVYQFEAHDYDKRRSYRWTNPDFAEAHLKESKLKLNLGEDVAYDDVKFVELEQTDDMLEKARAIYLGEDYDQRVKVPIDLPNELLFELMIKAHEKDITLNNLIEEAIQAAIDAYKLDPEGMKQKAAKWKEENSNEE